MMIPDDDGDGRESDGDEDAIAAALSTEHIFHWLTSYDNECCCWQLLGKVKLELTKGEAE